MAFFGEIPVPMPRTPIAAMFVIQFIYGWNQYLRPLLITTKEKYYTLLAMLPPVFVAGMTDSEK
jgi:sn-glycerol 3-phosphate transport system permease protein